jgi:hypothetical protein
VNVSGANPLRDWLCGVSVRVLIDTDPGFTQVRNLIDPAFRQRCSAHSAFFSFGENIGKSTTSIPDNGIEWHATRQAVSRSA